MSQESPQTMVMEERACWSLRLFGGFDLTTFSGGEKVSIPGKRERVLLAYLAVAPKNRQARRKLATLLWGDATDQTATDNLRVCVWGLRKSLGDAEHRIIASEGEDIVLDASAFEIDTRSFWRLAGLLGLPELEQAAKLYNGPFLDGLGIQNEEFESWRREEARRFNDQAVAVMDRLMTELAQAGDVERAIAAGRRLLSLDPFHEVAVRKLMRLYDQSDRRSAAIQLYRTLADSLKAELAVQPRRVRCTRRSPEAMISQSHLWRVPEPIR
jgi:DNA-binding SARP family transcriptional activator